MDPKDRKSGKHSIFTDAVHAGKDRQNHLGALSTPIYHASVFAFPNAEEGAAIHEGHQPGFYYGRSGNPTQQALENTIAALEEAQAALAFSSGMAAISTTLLHLLKAGDHIVAPKTIYATTRLLINRILGNNGIKISYIDASDPQNYQKAIQPATRVFYLESPANPTLSLIDVAAVAGIARKHRITTVIDNTFATPYNQRPLPMGIDLVLHSATKYLGGHSDLLAGVLAGSEETIQSIRRGTHKIIGGIIAPQTAWLVMRGIKTLALRMQQHNANGHQVAEFLESHPAVDRVYYPGLPSHPQHALAREQMDGFGGMIAFDVGTVDNGRRFLDALQLCTVGVSLGDVETLVQHSASMTHASVPREERLAAGISDGLIRLSVGIERAEDIIRDLAQGLDKLKKM